MKEKEKNFELKGTFIEKKGKKTFTKIISAQNKNRAKEKLLTVFGSKQGLKRRFIFIENIKEEN